MSITRRKPNSDETITLAINKAYNQMGIVSPAGMTLTVATQLRLTNVFTNWAAAFSDRDDAAFNKTSDTEKVEKTRATAYMYTRHFLMVFNFGVDRGVYNKAERSFFHIDVNVEKLPEMTSEAEIILWGNRVVDGDALRVAAGGAPMSNPTADEVKGVVTDFQKALNNKANSESAYKDALRAINLLRPEAEAVVLKVWDETETFYNELPAPAKRDKCRAWGIIYVSDQVITLNLTFEDAVTNLPIGDTTTYFVEGDTTHSGNADGFTEIKTTVSDEATLKTNALNYSEKTTVIAFETGVYEYTLTIKMSGI